ncbi:MAG: tetratricopeptide repeat protein [Pyrinomonadaceae bacterium]
MTSRSIWIAIIASVVSFAAGFLFANSLNRSELLSRQETDTAKPGQLTAAGPSDLTLTAEEIQTKIASADANPGNFTFQKNLGMSLYRYAAMKQDASILPDSLRIMERALAIEPADRDLQIAVGNAYFDKGYFNKDNASLLKAREFYRRVLVKTPGDVDVRADLALSYFLHDPPDLTTAVAEFEKGLEINPKHERALQFLTQTYIKRNEVEKAAETLERLKQANAANSAIGELTTLLANIGQVISK